jgi:hypothetical protein
MVRPRLTIYVCQESLQLREQQPQPQPQPQKQEDGDSNGTFFGRLFWAEQEERRRDDPCVAGVLRV